MFRKVLLLTFLDALTAQAAALRTQIEQTAEDDTSERVQELEAQAQILHIRARQVYHTFDKTESERFSENLKMFKAHLGENSLADLIAAIQAHSGADTPKSYRQPETTADVIEESTAEQLAAEQPATHPLAEQFPHLA